MTLRDDLDAAIERLLIERNRLAVEVDIVETVRLAQCDPDLTTQLLLTLVPAGRLIAQAACALDIGELDTRVASYSVLIESIEKLAADAANVDDSDAEAVRRYLAAVERVTRAVNQDSVSVPTRELAELAESAGELVDDLKGGIGSLVDFLTSPLTLAAVVVGGGALLFGRR